MATEVYRHTRRNVWSVRERGKVVCHCDYAFMANCRMVVQPGGRERVRRQGVKNVHAWIKGDMVEFGGARFHPADQNFGQEHWRRIYYSPYTCDRFEDLEGREVEGAERVWLHPDGRVFAQGLRFVGATGFDRAEKPPVGAARDLGSTPSASTT